MTLKKYNVVVFYTSECEIIANSENDAIEKAKEEEDFMHLQYERAYADIKEGIK